MKYFSIFFSTLWVIFSLLDPVSDPLTRLNPDLIRIRIRNPALKAGKGNKPKDMYIYVQHFVYIFPIIMYIKVAVDTSRVILSPMPGVVRSLSVAVGDKVRFLRDLCDAVQTGSYNGILDQL
jgi:hypothetical protein